MNIYIYNPEVEDLEKTYLTAALPAATTSLKVKNSNNFPNTRRILIGAPARERSEMVVQSAKTTTTLTVGSTLLPHDADDPVYALQYDQIRFYRSSTGVNGNYTNIATADINWDDPTDRTVYNDPNALDTYFYKSTFYDSIAGVESEMSPPIQLTGYPDNSVGDTILQTLREVNDEQFIVFDLTALIGIMNNISKDLYKQAKRPYRFLKRNVSLDVETNDTAVPFPADIWKINFVEVNQYNAGNNPLTYQPKEVDITTMRFRQSRHFLPSDYVNEIAFDDEANLMLFNPQARVTRIGAFNFHYYKKFTRFTDLADPLETPDNLIYQYGLKRAFYLRKMDDDSKWASQFAEFDKMYQAEIRMLQREKTIKAGGPTGMGADKKRYMQFGAPKYRQ